MSASAKEVLAKHVAWYMPGPDKETAERDAEDEARAILHILDVAGFAIVPKVAKEAVLGDTPCHSAEHAMPETASNDEWKV